MDIRIRMNIWVWMKRSGIVGFSFALAVFAVMLSCCHVGHVVILSTRLALKAVWMIGWDGWISLIFSSLPPSLLLFFCYFCFPFLP